MKFFDRLLTIVVTATVTSVIWIVFGGSLLGVVGGVRSDETAEPVAAEPVEQLEEVIQADDVTPPSTDAATPQAAPVATNSSTGETALVIPVTGVEAAQLTDSFMDARGEGGRLHEAIDIMAPKGSAVVAASSGTIAKLHVSPAGGNTIYLRSPDKTVIQFYAHLDGYASGLREGQRVAQGQRIGTVGSTGNAEADAPHLHFAILETTADAEWWEPANAVNPYPLLSATN